jgi:nitrogen regulatory protein P-II 2
VSMIWKHTRVFKFLLSNNFGEEMKLIIAIIQPEELPQIKEELIKRKIYKFTVTNAKGQGKEIPVQEVYRGLSHEVTLLNKVRLEIALNDDFVNDAIEAITKVAQKDGDKGRGKIFILPIEECIRIRSGERGSEAIG